MRVIVCGDRKFEDKKLVETVLESIWKRANGSLTILHGATAGAAALANAWVYAKRAGGAQIGVESYTAQWKNFGKCAGNVRNQTMLVKGKPDLIVMFPGDAETNDMLLRAERCGFQIECYGPEESSEKSSPSEASGSAIGSASSV